MLLKHGNVQSIFSSFVIISVALNSLLPTSMVLVNVDQLNSLAWLFYETLPKFRSLRSLRYNWCFVSLHIMSQSWLNCASHHQFYVWQASRNDPCVCSCCLWGVSEFVHVVCLLVSQTWRVLQLIEFHSGFEIRDDYTEHARLLEISVICSIAVV